MIATTFTQERLPWECALAQPPHDTEPLLWERLLTPREEAAMAALADWSWDAGGADVIAGVCRTCWLSGRACCGAPLIAPDSAGPRAGM